MFELHQVVELLGGGQELPPALQALASNTGSDLDSGLWLYALLAFVGVRLPWLRGRSPRPTSSAARRSGYFRRLGVEVPVDVKSSEAAVPRGRRADAAELALLQQACDLAVGAYMLPHGAKDLPEHVRKLGGSLIFARAGPVPGGPRRHAAGAAAPVAPADSSAALAAAAKQAAAARVRQTALDTAAVLAMGAALLLALALAAKAAALAVFSATMITMAVLPIVMLTAVGLVEAFSEAAVEMPPTMLAGAAAAGAAALYAAPKIQAGLVAGQMQPQQAAKHLDAQAAGVLGKLGVLTAFASARVRPWAAEAIAAARLPDPATPSAGYTVGLGASPAMAAKAPPGEAAVTVGAAAAVGPAGPAAELAAAPAPPEPPGWFACDCDLGGERVWAVVVRGSKSMSDWRLNLDFGAAVFEDAQDHSRGKAVFAHKGFYRAARALFEDPALRAVVDSARVMNRRVAFIGHSLGGSAATLLTLICVLHGVLKPEEIHGTYTFGSAEALCARARHLVHRCGLRREQFINVVNAHDVVPRLTTQVYPEVFRRTVVEGRVPGLGMNPISPFLRLAGLPEPRPADFEQHAAFLQTWRLCEPFGRVVHLVPDGRRGEGLRADVFEDLSDMRAMLDQPNVSELLLRRPREIPVFHVARMYRRAIRNAVRWDRRGGAALSEEQRAAGRREVLQNPMCGAAGAGEEPEAEANAGGVPAPDLVWATVSHG